MSSDETKKTGRKKTADLIQVAFKLEKSLLAKVDELAMQNGVNRSVILRNTVKYYFNPYDGIDRDNKHNLFPHSNNSKQNENNDIQNNNSEKEKHSTEKHNIEKHNTENVVSTLYYVDCTPDNNRNIFVSNITENMSGEYIGGMVASKSIFNIQSNNCKIYSTLMLNKDIMHLDDVYYCIKKFVEKFNRVDIGEERSYPGFKSELFYKFCDEVLRNRHDINSIWNIINESAYVNTQDEEVLHNTSCKHLSVIAKNLEFKAFEIKSMRGYETLYIVLPGTIFSLMSNQQLP